MKKAHLSSVTALLLSLSLVVGILVSDFAGARFLTTAYAQSGQCTSTTVITPAAEIGDGGTTAQNIILNGVVVGNRVITNGMIAGSVQISNSTLIGAGGVTVDGVIVGDGGQCTNGVIVGDGTGTDGVIVGDGTGMDGVIVGDGASVNGVVGGDGLTAYGGTLTGDGVIVGDGGIVTGSNLRLVGTTLTARSASANGIITSVQHARK